MHETVNLDAQEADMILYVGERDIGNGSVFKGGEIFGIETVFIGVFVLGLAAAFSGHVCSCESVFGISNGTLSSASERMASISPCGL